MRTAYDLFVACSKVLARELALQGRACGVGPDITSVNHISGNDGKRLCQSTRAADFPVDFVMGEESADSDKACDGGRGRAVVTRGKAWKAQSGPGQAAERHVAPDVWNGSDNPPGACILLWVPANLACGSRRCF
jgi:hypothetical protein